MFYVWYIFLTLFRLLGADPLWFEPQVQLVDIAAALDKNPSSVDDRNTLGQTGLMYAVNINRFGGFGTYDEKNGLVELLIERGADVNARSMKSPREEDHSFNNTALHYAAIQPNYHNTTVMIDYLIDAGALVNAKNNLGETPLMWTANLALLEDKVFIARKFIENLADINLQNNIGNTYLHILITNKDYSAVQELVKLFGSMFDLSIKNSEGWTPIDLAVNTLEPDSYRALTSIVPIGLSDGVDAVDILGRTGLMLAIIRNDLPFANRQLEERAAVGNQDTTRFGNTPLHFAVIRHYAALPFVKLLLEYKADPNIRTRYGDTPLHYLVRFNISNKERDGIANMLIQAGADPFIKNKKNISAFDEARKVDPSFATKLQTWSHKFKQKNASSGG